MIGDGVAWINPLFLTLVRTLSPTLTSAQNLTLGLILTPTPTLNSALATTLTNTLIIPNLKRIIILKNTKNKTNVNKNCKRN